MPSLRQKSKPATTTFIILGFAAALLATMAIRPLASLAAPVEPAEPPQLVFEPDHYDFGLQPLNWGSQQTNFQLRNAGSEAIQVGYPQISGPGSNAFWTGNSNCYGAVLQPGEVCYAQIYFGPNEAAEFTAQFSVNVGDYSFSAALSGTGGRASLQPDAAATDFGVARVGSAGTTREIEITNTGNMPGGAFIAVIAGGAIGSFQILDENCTGVELIPAATCTLQVRFQPVSEGVKKAMLGLFGEGEGPSPIILTGVGAAPDPAPAESSSSQAGGVAAAAADQPKAAKRKPKVRRHTKRRRLSVQGARLVLRAP
ncbi:MAG TPA: choice-of-anchor D domain-containing protein [Solirubrobacterales bacterium]|nr:choice-of-anchor D domain-containing protein [Solirubrobacterales bacterium]